MLINGSKELWLAVSGQARRSDQQDSFILSHFSPIQEAFGGEYPAIMYPVFANTLASFNRRNIPTDEMVAAALEDVDLNTYLLDNLGLRFK